MASKVNCRYTLAVKRQANEDEKVKKKISVEMIFILFYSVIAVVIAIVIAFGNYSQPFAIQQKETIDNDNNNNGVQRESKKKNTKNIYIYI